MYLDYPGESMLDPNVKLPSTSLSKPMKSKTIKFRFTDNVGFYKLPIVPFKELPSDPNLELILMGFSVSLITSPVQHIAFQIA